MVSGTWNGVWNFIGILIGGALNGIRAVILVGWALEAVRWSGLFVTLRVLECWQVLLLIGLVCDT